MNKLELIANQLLGENSDKQTFTEEDKKRFHSNAISAMTNVLSELNIEHSGDESEILELFKPLVVDKVETPSIKEAIISVFMDTQEGQSYLLSAMNFEIPAHLKPVVEAFSESKLP